MYDPFQPTNIPLYRKRLRAEAEAANLRRQVQQPVAIAASFEVCPEELHRQRLVTSASLGVRAAKEALDEEADLQHKLKKHEGSDRVSKMSKLLGRLGEEGGSEDGALSKRSVESLIFVPGGLAAGGHRITATEAPKVAKAPFRGKPSSTVVLTGWCRAPSSSQAEGAWVDIDALQGQEDAQYLQDVKIFAKYIQQSCGSYGVVRNGRLGCTTSANLMTTTTSWRLFLRFDNVSSAFRAVEALQGLRTGALWEKVRPSATPIPLPATLLDDRNREGDTATVAFYNTVKYDSGNFLEPI